MFVVFCIPYMLITVIVLDLVIVVYGFLFYLPLWIFGLNKKLPPVDDILELVFDKFRDQLNDLYEKC